MNQTPILKQQHVLRMSRTGLLSSEDWFVSQEALDVHVGDTRRSVEASASSPAENPAPDAGV